MALFRNVFHTNCIIFNVLKFLCLKGSERSLCCALLPPMRVYVLPWLLRGCKSPGWLSWDLWKAWFFSSVCQGATCPIGGEQPHLFPLIFSVKVQVNDFVNFQMEISQGQSTKQKEGITSKVQLPIPQAVWWDLKGSCFLNQSILLLPQLEIWGISVKILSSEAGCTATVCYGTDFQILLWYSRIWAHGVSWTHFDEVTLTISPFLSVAGTAEASNIAWE